jgi:hypothetical protein
VLYFLQCIIIIIVIIVIIVIIIIIILVVSFMQGVCNYIPEANRVSRVYSVAAVLYLQFVLRVKVMCFVLLH